LEEFDVLGIPLSATLVRVFVASHVDYCNALLAGAPTVMMDELQRVLNAVARVVSGANKFDLGLSRFCTPSYTCSMYLSESRTSWALWYTAACMAKLHSTWWISAIRPSVLHHDSNFDLWSFHVAGEAPLPCGLSLRFVHWCGILWQTTCAILLSAEII